MQDLTQGPIPKHVLRMAAPIMVGMLFQTLYFLIDLYFVARLGDAAVAGVGAAGNVQFIVMALTQILGVGTMALISHAVGRKDRDDANLVFNQSLLLALACTAVTLVGGYALGGAYMRTLGADAATTQAGIDYLYWFLPGLALQFAQIAMGSALRGTGIAKPTMVVQMLTVVLNAILAPVLIAGWLTGKPMGVAGAGLATSISIAAGVVMMALYFARLEKYVGFDRSQFHARLEVWKRILRIGLPPGGEFALMFVYMAAIYWAIRGFGAEAQAGFGIGQRVMQAIFLPAMAISFATAPVAGQNVGARRPERVRATFYASAMIGSVLMLALTALCQWQPSWLVGVFTQEPAVIAVGAQFLGVISLNFVASGLIFTCSGMFQALGDTLPALLSSASRMLTFALPALWLSTRPDFELRQLWLLSVASVALQAVISVLLLLRALRRADRRMATAAAAT
ncbi:MATE family efflux transporter [Lysobacter silvisoli]|uniref:Multidrug-efflux transporter n=1 Tax=Lysobacter silvisoli TaxID=2293254 RepID=A0A371JWA7_9GAMM|nr:MATE family efflux transporter [Lysobacter silvisoli]RDZ25938.1 MATE family efflux transporter [Lysobacter silvisoli]